MSDYRLVAEWVSYGGADLKAAMDRSKTISEEKIKKALETPCPIEELIIDEAMLAMRDGLQTHVLEVDHETFGQLADELGARREYYDDKIGRRRALEIQGPLGEIFVFPKKVTK